MNKHLEAIVVPAEKLARERLKGGVELLDWMITPLGVVFNTRKFKLPKDVPEVWECFDCGHIVFETLTILFSDLEGNEFDLP